ncbi:hypothetical protein [Paracoccus sp. SSK6]|uniref:hypothetical protein n=1 Tax=Paracoccus sp. SSK6 TaxID=3143131 RepID=UPI00321C088D
MKVLRKPQYLGTKSQTNAIIALAGANGSYADRQAAARAVIGKSLVGSTVGLVKLGKSQFIVSTDDLPSLPSNVRPYAFAVVAQCNDKGAVFLTKA